MRKYSTLAIMATILVGSSAFANEGSVEYRCELESAKGKGGRCEVRGEICFDRGPGANEECRRESRDRVEASIAVRCTDGFRLWDKHAEVDRDRKDLVIEGEKHDSEAVLVVEDFFKRHDDRGEYEFDAVLVTSEDGDENTYAGECEFRRGGHGPEPVL